MRRVRPPAVLVGLVAFLLPACASWGIAASPSGDGRTLRVVAAEDMWGSLARQLGGERVSVRSLVANPVADPHDYEPTASDARAVAAARLVITNGIGYDSWATKMLAANPADGRTVLDVGRLVSLAAGQNPHAWYSPAVVGQVISAITSRYKQLDAAHASFYDAQRAAFEATALARYFGLISAIKARFAGTPVGASESILSPLADALGLRVLTPRPFLEAVAERADPTAADKATVDRQITSRAIKVFVYNSQNATPDVQRLVGAARAAGVPVTTITETLTPGGSTFQDWQVRQLEALQAALADGTRA